MDNQYDKTINEKEYCWNLIESYFKDKHLEKLVAHQIESYNDFTSNQLVKTIEMFNPINIVSEHDYIKEHNIYRLHVSIIIENFNIHRPQVYENNGATKIMFPHEARLRNFTYAGAMTVNLKIKYTVRTGENFQDIREYNNVLTNIHIGKLPIMLRSNICVLNQYKHLDNNQTGECYMDPGGYFIINGSEKTCLGQERAAENQIYCFFTEKNTKWSWTAEMKSIPDWKCISPKQINIMISTKNNGFGNPIYLQIPRLKNPIPLFIVFRAFNIISDKDICERIILDTEDKKLNKLLFALRASIVDANNIITYDSAVKYIISNVAYTPVNVDKDTGIKKRQDFANEVINNDIFPHCKTNVQKMYMLGYMTNILLQTSFGWIDETDRDSYINKRIDLTGTLINNLFRNYLNKLVKDMQKQIIREINTGSWKYHEDYLHIITNTNIYKIVKSTTIENGIKRALATGDFGIKQLNSNKVGVAQVLNRLTYAGTISHLRRVNTPIDKSGKLVPPRRLHNSSWGYICPAESPEGQSVGIVKNLSYMACITIPSNSSGLYDYILPLIIKIDDITKTSTKIANMFKVFINGAWVGITEEPIELYNKLKDKKYKGIINVFTSIIIDIKRKEVKVCNDAGRLIRPLYRVKNNKIICNSDIIKRIISGELEWNDTLYSAKIDESVIEYIDAYEQNNAMISMEPSQLKNKKNDNYIYHYTHCEIHPSTIFGVLASCIPFPEHNQAPRNTYQCLDPNTPVIMKDHSTKLIKDIKIGDEVITFDPISMKISDTKIINQYVRETTKPCFKLTTYSGKSIKATGDHKFITYNRMYLAWKEIQNYNTRKDLIGIYWNNYVDLPNKCNEKFEIYTLPKLKNNEYRFIPAMMPSFSTDKNIRILARLFGFIKYNPNYKEDESYYIKFKSTEDRNDFENDIRLIGKKPFIYRTWFELNTDNVSEEDISIMPNNYEFNTYLHYIGINEDNLPKWIMENSLDVKREFLAGYLSNIIDDNKLYDYYDLQFYIKNYRHKNDIIQLLKELNINYSYKRNCIFKSYIKPRFSQFVNTVGIRYNNFKSAFLAILNECNHLSTIREKQYFIKKCKTTQYYTIFVPIKSIIKINMTIIADITTESNNHSFILGNGLMTHNSAMCKQSLGVYVTNFDNRMDKTAYVLTYPMRPMVDTRIMNITKMNDIPSGEQPVVAIMSHTGYNQEDSILINKASIDRGLFSATIYHTEKDEDKKLYGNEEIRCKPDKSKTKNIKFANYDKINEDGIIPENTIVKDRDIIIGKILPIKENKNDYTKTIKYTDESHIYRTHEETYIDKNYIESNGDGYKFCKVRLRNYRKPVIGDKLSSRHGQKGTVGNVIPEKDMPFTDDGIRPDIIINPHAIPSRMTIAQLKETLLGKVLVQLGLFGDGTSFGKLDISTIANKLTELGYESKGNEIMYNPLTGEQLQSSIFIGPVFYQRLKHMVNDKQHSRSIGPMVSLTRQPAEGRARDGGLRFGEMERDAMVSHGASRFTKGRLYDQSDAYSIHVCNKCGLIAAFNNKQNIHICYTCENRTDFKYVELPYACKLLFQELLTMNIAPRIITE